MPHVEMAYDGTGDELIYYLPGVAEQHEGESETTLRYRHGDLIGSTCCLTTEAGELDGAALECVGTLARQPGWAPRGC
ncbi:MAG: hypothetical protein KAS72_03130 [Phycisphaerales bacterium]|nr:hypothetical protein [Phycisphaerales bacterium]